MSDIDFEGTYMSAEQASQHVERLQVWLNRQGFSGAESYFVVKKWLRAHLNKELRKAEIQKKVE